jgi:diguanylate cyclase (GGDEF)-like protein/PAS domain S-box-containing protein
VLAVAAIALGVVQAVADQRAASHWIKHVQLVLLQSADLELHLERTVSEGRGYHISRDTADLARFQAAEQRVRQDLAELRASTAETPEQQRRLDAVTPMILARLALLHRLVDVDPASPRYTELSAPGMLTAVQDAQRISDGLAELRAAATRLLTEQQAAVARTWRLTAAAITAGGGLLSASCVLILVLLARHRREHQHLLELSALNQALEERVRARTAELATAHERMAIATEHGGVGIWDWDVATGRVVWSRRVYSLYDADPAREPASLALWRRRLHPQDRAAAEAALQDALDGHGEWDCEYRIIRDDGSIRWVRSVGRVIRDADGRPVRMLGSNCDVTEARHLTTRLAEQRELLEVTLQAIGDGVITTDAAGRVRWLNPAAERMTGWIAEDAAGEAIAQVLQIRHAATRLPADNPVARCLAEGRVVGLAGDAVLISRHGEEYGIADSASPIRNRRGEVLGAVVVFHDVTEQRRLSAELSYRAAHDPLTGLLNRAEFELRLHQTLRRAQEEGSRHALLCLDLDQFKAVNDTCGHVVGDWLLQQVARLLRGVVRASDCVARLGGDEFAVILDHCDGGPAERLAARMCQAAEEFRFTHAERQYRLGASIGLVMIDAGWASAGAILEAADAACYAAKAAGRNRVHLWRDTDASRQARLSQTQWAARLEAALAADGLLLFAQRIDPLHLNGPPVPASSGQAPPAPGADAAGLHAEVLVRLADGDAAPILPGAFLAAAERFELAGRLDRWVLSRTLHMLGTHPAAPRICMLAVNVTAASAGDRVFQTWTLERLAEAGPAVCGRLCLEVTEAAAAGNVVDVAGFVRAVRALGVRVALDDFGTGAGAFTTLKTVPADLLKIDGRFIRDLATDALDGALVRGFAAAAAIAGTRTVAKSVEDPAVLERVRGLGIDFAQGFLIHRPVPLAMLLEPAPTGCG